MAVKIKRNQRLINKDSIHLSESEIKHILDNRTLQEALANTFYIKVEDLAMVYFTGDKRAGNIQNLLMDIIPSKLSFDGFYVKNGVTPTQLANITVESDYGQAVSLYTYIRQVAGKETPYDPVDYGYGEDGGSGSMFEPLPTTSMFTL